jgi:hypothetical protein
METIGPATPFSTFRWSRTKGARSRILGTDPAAHVARVASPGPEEPKLLENYQANAPVITFVR